MTLTSALHKSEIEIIKSKIEDLKTEKLVGEKINKEDQKKIIERLRTLGYVN